MQILQPLLRHVCVYLCCGEICMPEQHLHHPEIRSVIQQMGSERMPQGVGRQRGADLCALGVELDPVPKGLSRHLLPPQTREQKVIGFFGD